MFETIIRKIFGDHRDPNTQWTEKFIEEIEKGGKIYRNLSKNRICAYRTFGGYYIVKAQHGYEVKCIDIEAVRKELNSLYIRDHI